MLHAHNISPSTVTNNAALSLVTGHLRPLKHRLDLPTFNPFEQAIYEKGIRLIEEAGWVPPEAGADARRLRGKVTPLTAAIAQVFGYPCDSKEWKDIRRFLCTNSNSPSDYKRSVIDALREYCRQKQSQHSTLHDHWG